MAYNNKANNTSFRAKVGKKEQQSVDLGRLVKIRQNRWLYLGLIYILFF